jgi:hypothetical protein
MATADEYHQYARECLQWAAEAENEEQRNNFLAMARTWTHAALQVASARVPIKDHPPFR